MPLEAISIREPIEGHLRPLERPSERPSEAIRGRQRSHERGRQRGHQSARLVLSESHIRVTLPWRELSEKGTASQNVS
jgi:hypothetical protein